MDVAWSDTTGDLTTTLTKAFRQVIQNEIDRVEKTSHRISTLTLGEELHERVTDHYAHRVAEAMSDVDGIEAAIEAARKVWPDVAKADNETPPVTPVPAAGFSQSSDLGPVGGDIATSAIAANVVFNTDAIQQTLTDLYGSAGLAGAGVAAQHLGTVAGSDFSAMLPEINWYTWHPGDLDSARLVANGELRRVLDSADIVLRGLTDSAVDRMGTVLANGLNEGLAPATIASQMRDVVADPARAMVIARTETARAQVASSLDSYRANDTEEVDWHANDGACPICIELDAGSPYPIDDVPDFPHHPNDRCQILPHIDL